MENINKTRTIAYYKKILIPFAIIIGIVILYFAYTAPEFYKWLIGILILIGVLLFSLRSPFYAFIIFIITLPLESTFVIESGFTIRPAYVALLFIFFLMFISNKLYRSFKSPLSVPIFIYIIVSFLSLIMTIFFPLPEVAFIEAIKYRGTNFRGIIQLFLLIFFAMSYFLTIYFCSNRKRLIIILKVYISVALILSIYGVYQILASHYNLPFADITNAISTNAMGYAGPFSNVRDITIFRSFATFQEPLNFGHYLISIIPIVLMLYLYKEKNKIAKDNYVHIGLIPLLVILAALFFTRSRGAWLGLVSAILFIALMIERKHRLKLMFMFIIPSIIILFILFRSVGLNYFRINENILLLDPRWKYMLFALKFWVRHPVLWILGVGIGNYGLHAAAAFELPTLGGANSLPLQILVETGILGFFAMIFLLYRYYSYMLQMLKNCRGSIWYPLILGYLAGFTAMITQYLIFADRPSLYLWVFMGISIATGKTIIKEKSSHNLTGG